MAVHGDIKELTVNHPIIGSVSFTPKANEDNQYEPGGLRNGDDVNQIAGNGGLIWQKNRRRGELTIVVENDVLTRQDAEKLHQLSESPIEGVWTFSTMSGAIFRGTGMPVGDITPNLNTGMTSITVHARRFEKL